MTPALRAALDEHRYLRQSELHELAALLNDYGLTPDIGPLSDAASSCLGAPRTVPPGLPDAGRTYWGYRIEGLQLRLEEQRHCRPRATRADNLTGILSVDVEEYVPDDPGSVGESFRYLRRLDAQFVCDAEAVFAGETHQLRAAWHVDTHLHTATQSSSVHPRFHFQVGGNELAGIDDTIRGALLTEAPRPATAPLDGILAVDFVLSHYSGGAWEVLRALEARYGRLRTPSMKRYWGPYFRVLSEALAAEEAVGHGSSAGLLLPNLVTG